MRMRWLLIAAAGLMVGAACSRAQQRDSPERLVREVVYNELHDHQRHGYWRYWIEQRSARQTKLQEQVETPQGPMTRLVEANGRLLNPDDRRQEEERLQQLLASPMEQARLRQEHADDEERIGRIVALLPDAFLYQYAGTEDGCYRLRFRPNPDYPAHGVETRIFHAMSGELWIDARYKRLARLKGQLKENVDFGYGLLGRLYKGGWFLLERVRVSETDWKTTRLEVHMSGRALLFKTIARETSEVRGGFTAVPAGLSLAQAMNLLSVQPTSLPTATASLVELR